MVSLVKILIECVLQGGNSEVKQKLNLHKLSLGSLTRTIPSSWREALRSQRGHSAPVEFNTEHDSRVTLHRCVTLVGRQGLS